MVWERAWVKTAKNLPVGDKLRIKCCGLDNSRTITHKVDCYLTDCFRCKESAVERKTALAVLKSQADVEHFKKKVKDKKLRLTETLDSKAIAWLLLADIKPHLWSKYSIKQCLDTGMVFLPIPINKRYNGFILRNVYGKKPKYISDIKMSFAALGTGDPVVVVEDYLSAIRIHEDAGYAVVCAMGTGTPAETKLHIMNNHKHVIVWTDSDKAGREADTAWSKELSALGIRVDSVVTEQDPKLLSRREIINVLESIDVGT